MSMLETDLNLIKADHVHLGDRIKFRFRKCVGRVGEEVTEVLDG